jgi:hypothetical protein
MKSDNGLEAPLDGVPSLEEELVHQFGPNILGDSGSNTDMNTDAMDEEDESPEDGLGAPEDFFDEVPMDLCAGAHVVWSSSEDEDEVEHNENPLRAIIKKNQTVSGICAYRVS